MQSRLRGRGGEALTTLTSANDTAVATAIRLMYENLARPLRLHELADAAYLSPFHFDRVFTATTGLSAVAFASALRIDAAKRLLANADASVTDVCYALGYESLGSFVSRFARSVGVPPGALRNSLARDDGAPVLAPAETRIRLANGGHKISGVIGGDAPSDGVVWIGAFARGLPGGPPLAGTILHGAGPFRIDALAPGKYHVMAFGLPRATPLRGYLDPDGSARVGKGGAVVVGPALPTPFVTIDLAPPCATDPPVLVALPLITSNRARSK